jgi:hypothetical protein
MSLSLLLSVILSLFGDSVRHSKTAILRGRFGDRTRLRQALGRSGFLYKVLPGKNMTVVLAGFGGSSKFSQLGCLRYKSLRGSCDARPAMSNGGSCRPFFAARDSFIQRVTSHTFPLFQIQLLSFDEAWDKSG